VQFEFQGGHLGFGGTKKKKKARTAGLRVLESFILHHDALSISACTWEEVNAFGWELGLTCYP
jgi:hypothetical protein